MVQNVRKMLAPIDFSEYSMGALNAAWELAQDFKAELHIMHVVAPAPHFYLPFADSPERNRQLAVQSAMVDQTDEELQRLKKEQFADNKSIVTAVVKGHAVQQIVAYAKEQSIDLIMLATHGHTGAEHLVIGSVAEKLCRLAPCSVLIYRGPRA
ncbi:MAG: universal stress protein [Pseudomonadota bacterium]